MKIKTRISFIETRAEKLFSLFLLYLLLLLSPSLFAQQGHLFLTHYKPKGHESGYHCMNIIQGNNGNMYFGSPSGISVYDGTRTHKVKTPGPVFSLINDSVRNTIYVSCRNNFGYLWTNEYGQEMYIPIKKTSEDAGNIHHGLIADSSVWFFSDNQIFQVNTHAKTTAAIINLSEGKFAGAFKLKGKVYVNIKGYGLHYVLNDHILPAGLHHLQSVDILFSISYNKNEVILGCSDNTLYLFDGKRISHFEIKDETNLSHWLLVDAIALSSDKIAIATASAGCLIVNLKTRETIHYLNYFKGLPDDEIFALGFDKDGGLWLAHDNGFSRADSRVPFRVFSHYPGLEGNIISVLEANNRVYVATNEGLFFLQESSPPKTPKFVPNSEAINNSRNQHWYYRKRGSYTTSDDLRVTEFFDFTYKRIQGIYGKCRKLFTANGKVYMITNTGVFRIWGKASQTILKDVYINNAAYDRKGNILLAMKTGLYKIGTGKIWKDGEVRSVSCINNEVWFESENTIYKGVFEQNGKFRVLNSYPLSSNFFSEPKIQEINGEVYFLSESEILKYNRKTDHIAVTGEDSELRKSKYIHSQDELTWVRADSGWIGFTSNGKEVLFNRYMLLQKDIEGIFVTENNNLWTVQSNNELIRLVGKVSKDPLPGFKIDICGISTEKNNWCTLQKPVLPPNFNNLTIHVTAPHFLANEQVEIQYLLKGAMEEWSGWNQDKEIQFPFLPVGEHKLMIRGKNSLGEISEVKEINFSVAPPYWKTTWFYFLEILFFGSLIVISVFLNRNRNQKNIFLTKALTFLTLIILVEFIDEIIKASWAIEEFESPVISFALDVILALLITPIEKVLEVLIRKRRRQWLYFMIMYRKNSLNVIKKLKTELPERIKETLNK